jgi:hypothetical protein
LIEMQCRASVRTAFLELLLSLFPLMASNRLKKLDSAAVKCRQSFRPVKILLAAARL